MKILVICQRYWPEQFQITSICEGLVSRGHEVTVLCGLPNVGVPDGMEGHVEPAYRRGKNRNQIHNGVKIIRSFEMGRRAGPFWRMLNYLSFWKSASRKVLRIEEAFDVVFAYQLSPATMCIPADVLKRSKGTPYLLYCCDAWPEWVRAVLGNKFRLIYKFFDKACSRMYRDADSLVVQTPSYISYFADHYGIKASRLHYIPQFSTDGAVVDESQHEGVNMLFAGNMGTLQCIPLILEAFSQCLDIEEFKLHFVGDGSERENAVKFVEQNGLGNRVFFHGRKRFDEMSRFYEMADICVLALDSSTVIGSTIPAKLQGYMAAGKPVVAAIGGGARYVIEESHCGFASDPADAKSLADTMRRLAMDQGLRRRLGDNGRRYYETFFTKEAYLNAMEEQLSIVSKKVSHVE